MKPVLIAVLAMLLASFRTHAAAATPARRLTLGVFLPTTLSDGQARFELGMALAEALSKRFEQPVSAKSFGRFEDFARAAADGTLDLGLVEAWAAAESAARMELLAQAVVGGEATQRWAVVAPGVDNVAQLAGKRLAVTRGALGMDSAFAANVVFGGDLVAGKHFKIVAVPAVESALQMVGAKSAEAALVPLPNVPKGAKVVFRSGRVPGPVVVSFKAVGAPVREALLSLGPIAPLDSFIDAKGNELVDLKRLIAKGPPPRLPVIAESPVLRPRLDGLLDLRSVGLGFPSFVDAVDVGGEAPND